MTLKELSDLLRAYIEDEDSADNQVMVVTPQRWEAHPIQRVESEPSADGGMDILIFT